MQTYLTRNQAINKPALRLEQSKLESNISDKHRVGERKGENVQLHATLHHTIGAYKCQKLTVQVRTQTLGKYLCTQAFKCHIILCKC